MAFSCNTFTHCADGQRTIATGSYNINPTVRLNKISGKNGQYKTWCKGNKSNIENSIDHFCEDTRLNALAALKKLGHVISIISRVP